MNIEKLFPIKKNCLYFNFSSDGPLPDPARRAITLAAEKRMNVGMIDVKKQTALYEDIRSELSRLFKSKADNFAFVKNTSEGVLLALLALNIKEDENYIVAEDAFPTTVKVMENHCKGRMRKVKINSPVNICDQVAAAMDEKTKVIVLDWVHYFSGKIVDLERLTEIAGKNNTFTIIDGIQGAGALNIELDKSGVDFFFSAGHKWMLATQGTGFIYAADKVWERVQRKAFGWLGYEWKDFSDFDIKAELRPGAAVFEYGTRSFSAGTGFLEALKVINERGIENIEAHNRRLRRFFVEEIGKKGYETIDNHNIRSASIVPFKSPGVDSKLLKRRLDEKNIKVALRNGYIRASFHFINDKQEIEKFIDIL
ncbi:aminotransferase class V-fold PLP-dependent enzyme [Acidobacteriota bacterium]